MPMTFSRALRRPLLAAVFFVASVSVAAADSITLSAVSRGSVASTGIHSGDAGLSNGNFVTGFHAGAEQRSFFVFDLAGVLNPIVGATLTLELNPGVTPPYISSDDHETVSFVQYTGMVSALFASGSPPVLDADQIGNIFNNIGGTTYGSVTLFPTSTGTVQVTFNEAGIAAINASRSAGEFFAFGGVLASLSSPMCTNGCREELVFASSINEFVNMELQPVPEPASVVLFGTGLCLLAERRRRQRRTR